jgi:hypothetical protein
MPNGTPWTHQGVSHTLKHFLAAAEAWEDISEGLPDHLRPRATALRLRLNDAIALVDFPERHHVLASLWGALCHALWEGYMPIVAGLLQSMPEPRRGEGPWRQSRSGWIAHIGDGVVAVVSASLGEPRWQLRTAYRPLDFKLRDYGCPPVDATNVSIRRRLALYVATQKLTQRPEQ